MVTDYIEHHVRCEECPARNCCDERVHKALKAMNEMYQNRLKELEDGNDPS